MAEKVVALVDDEEVFHWITGQFIKNSGLQAKTISFFNGQQMIEYLNENTEQQPDIILLDINMPVMNGWAFLDTVTSKNLQLESTIYILTSSIDPEDRRKAERYSVISGFINKPVSEEILKKILK